MAATFIKKDDGNFYMRLTESTTDVKFAAASNAGNTYTFSVNGIVVVTKTTDDAGGTYYTPSASPIPSGGTQVPGGPSWSRFPGAETTYSYSGSGIRDYLAQFQAYTGGVPSYNTQFYLGGASLTWGGYAYPGSGYLSNPLAVGVKDGGSWKNAGNMFIKNANEWKEVQTAWIKQNGTWKQFFQNYGNSSWINMLELTDDAIDFAVQVIALN